VITYQIERWSGFYADALPLFERHDRELADEKTPLDVFTESYEQMDKTGSLQILTARDGDILVGYCLFIISPNLARKTMICATQNIFYVSPEYRGNTGVRLLKKSIRFLQLRGVHRVYPHHWSDSKSLRLGGLYKKLGATLQEYGYSIDL
jgi:hypothetical protein